MNLRPLGYEPYDASLWRLGPSLVGVVTSADRTDPVPLRRLRLPRLVLSRSVRFTNRFTEQVIDLQFPYPSCPSAAAILGAPHRVPVRQATSPPVMPDVEPRSPGRRRRRQACGQPGQRRPAGHHHQAPSAAGQQRPHLGCVRRVVQHDQHPPPGQHAAVRPAPHRTGTSAGIWEAGTPRAARNQPATSSGLTAAPPAS